MSWQDWDAYRGGAAKWWISTGAGGCGQATPCTWNTIGAASRTRRCARARAAATPTFPKPVCPGSLGVNQGSGNQSVISNADALYVTVGGNKTTFDFETVVDTTGPECGAFVIRRNPGGQDEADVTLHDNGSGIASITNFIVTNGTAIIPAFTQGARVGDGHGAARRSRAR